MKSRFAISLIFVTAFMLLSQPLIADDLAELKATNERYDKAWNTGDMETVFEIWQDGGIWIPSEWAFPMVTNSAVGKQMFAQWLETHIYQYGWYKVDYRVIGDMGLVWGVTTETIIVKATGKGKRTFYKNSLVYVRTDGQWKAVMAHSSKIPSEAEIY